MHVWAFERVGALHEISTSSGRTALSPNSAAQADATHVAPCRPAALPPPGLTVPPHRCVQDRNGPPHGRAARARRLRRRAAVWGRRTQQQLSSYQSLVCGCPPLAEVRAWPTSCPPLCTAPAFPRAFTSRSSHRARCRLLRKKTRFGCPELTPLHLPRLAQARAGLGGVALAGSGDGRPEEEAEQAEDSPAQGQRETSHKRTQRARRAGAAASDPSAPQRAPSRACDHSCS